jgi:drug/metabolite transporter (DMT)-like permease
MRGALWMLGGVAGLGMVVIAVRALKPEIHLLELLFLRALIGLVVITVIMLARGGHGFRSQRPGQQWLRNGSHVIGQFCVFYGVLAIPLAEVTSIEYTIPAMTAGLAALFLGEKVGRHRWIGMAISFTGVLFIVRPVFADIPPAMFVVILGAVFFAIQNVYVRILSQVEGASTLVFQMNLIQSLILLGPALYVWITPSWHHLPWLAALGLAGMIAHFCMGRALGLADTSVCMPLDFLRLPFIAGTAFLVWGETFSPWSALGAVIIFGGQYYAIMRERSRSGRP